MTARVSKHFWIGVALVALTIHAAPARAQYHTFTPVTDAVEVDLSVLRDLPIPANQRPRTFKKLAPPPLAGQSDLGVFPEPLVKEEPVPQLVMPAPKKQPGVSYPPAMPSANLADMPEDKLLAPMRMTPPDLPPSAISTPVEAMPEMPIPLTAAPEILPPPAMPAPKPRRVLKPSDEPMADAAPEITWNDAQPVEQSQVAATPAPLPTPKPEMPAAPQVAYPSYMTKPGQVSGPSHVDRPSPKPAFEETAPAMPAHKPEIAAEPVALPAPKVLKPDDSAPIPLTFPEQVAEEKAPEVAPMTEAPQPAAPVVEITPEPEMAAPEVSAPEVSAAPAAVPSASDLSLEFGGNGSDLSPDAETKLKNIVKQMESLGDMRLQVRAYATGEDGSKLSARRISLSRALAVRSYLMDAGIKPTRVDVRALGTETDRSPLDRVDLIFAR